MPLAVRCPGRLRQPFAVDADAAGAGDLDPDQHPGQRGLAGAGLAGNAEALSLANRQRDIAHGVDVAVATRPLVTGVERLRQPLDLHGKGRRLGHRGARSVSSVLGARPRGCRRTRSRLKLEQRGRHLLARSDGITAALPEGAARRGLAGRARTAWHNVQTLDLAVQTRPRVDQGCRVRVGRGLEQLRCRLRCHGTTGVRHHDLVADHRGEREVIGDEQQRQTLVTHDARTRSDDWSADCRPTADTCAKRQLIGRQVRAPGLVPGARDGGFRSGCVSCFGLPSGSTCGRSPCTTAAHGGYRGGRGSRATRVG